MRPLLGSVRGVLRPIALAAGLALSAPHALADGIDLSLGGFVQLDHYGLLAEERLYTNERIRLTAAAQVEAVNATGDVAAFAELRPSPRSASTSRCRRRPSNGASAR